MRDDEVPAGPVVQKPAEEQDEDAERKIDAQIDELIRVFDNPNAPFEEKMHALIRIPTEIQFQHVLMTRDRADRLFSKIPVEMYRHVFDPDVKEYAYARPILIHILAFFCQCSTPEVHLKFKTLMENIVKATSPKELKPVKKSSVYHDLAVIVAFWVDTEGDGKYLYDALRYSTGYYASQKQDLDVIQFLICIRLLINKVYQMFSVETPNCYDGRGWPFGILSVVRDVLQHSHQRLTNEIRVLLWEVISAMTRLGGTAWFNSDKNFAKLVIQMNHVELQMTLHDPENVDSIGFQRHLRVLELFTNAICDKEMYGEEGMEVIPHTVGDSTRYILTFWVECYLQKIKIPDSVNISIFNYATFLFVHEELALTEANVRKNIGPVFLENAFKIIENTSEPDLRTETGQMFCDLLERFSEFETLDERVPVLIVKFLEKLRTREHYEEWKGRVIDCKCCIMDLRGRIDWYSVKTLNEAKALTDGFTEPEKHEMKQIFSIFDKLPRVK